MIDRIKKKRKSGEVPVDNFVAFKERLTNASTDLHERQSQLDTRLSVLKTLLFVNGMALGNWENRLSKVSDMHAAYSGDEEGERVLSDLLKTATRMHALFSKRADVLVSQAASVTSKVNNIKAAIEEVDASVSKLEVSKMLQDDREKLALAEVKLGGGTNMPLNLTSDANGLPHELRTAREAVAMAEALLELRGN